MLSCTSIEEQKGEPLPQLMLMTEFQKNADDLLPAAIKLVDYTQANYRAPPRHRRQLQRLGKLPRH